MKLLKTSIPLIFVILLASCGSNVRTDKEVPKQELKDYQTFAYLPNSNAEMPGESYNDEQINSFIVETVNNNLEEAGYTLDRDNPDLLVLISTKIRERTETTRDPVYATYPYSTGVTTINPAYNTNYYRGYGNFTTFAGYNTNSYDYDEGTVIIDLVDRKTKESVWKGIASDNLYSQATSQAIEELVKEIFDQYPLIEDNTDD